MTYQEQLRDPRWQKRKSQICNRDNWACKSCTKSDVTLHVHHIFYFSFLMAWDYPNDLLITLCMDCHEKEKERPELQKDLAVALQLNGFLYSDLLCLSQLVHDKKFSRSLIKKLRKIQNG